MTCLQSRRHHALGNVGAALEHVKVDGARNEESAHAAHKALAVRPTAGQAVVAAAETLRRRVVDSTCVTVPAQHHTSYILVSKVCSLHVHVTTGSTTVLRNTTRLGSFTCARPPPCLDYQGCRSYMTYYMIFDKRKKNYLFYVNVLAFSLGEAPRTEATEIYFSGILIFCILPIRL